MLVASVPMNELIRVRKMMSPLAIPSPTPAITPRKRPKPGFVAFAAFAETTPETLTIAAADRSKTPAMMQSVSPIVTNPAAAHDENAVREPEHLLELRRDQENRHPLRGEADDQLVDLVLRPDVDAARWLVRDQDARSADEPLREQRLLLVAS